MPTCWPVRHIMAHACPAGPPARSLARTHACTHARTHAITDARLAKCTHTCTHVCMRVHTCAPARIDSRQQQAEGECAGRCDACATPDAVQHALRLPRPPRPSARPPADNTCMPALQRGHRSSNKRARSPADKENCRAERHQCARVCALVRAWIACMCVDCVYVLCFCAHKCIRHGTELTSKRVSMNRVAMLLTLTRLSMLQLRTCLHCVHVCIACMRAVCSCVRACVRACVRTCEWWDSSNNGQPAATKATAPMCAPTHAPTNAPTCACRRVHTQRQCFDDYDKCL